MARIYVCDDDKDYIQLLVDYLKDLGHSAIGVLDPEALRQLRASGEPDLVILDIQAPGGGGPAAARALPPRVPIIVASGMPLALQKQWFPDGRPIRFVQKPLDWKALEQALDALLKLSLQAAPNSA